MAAHKRVCDGCGKEYWWPGARWQHDACQFKVRVDEPADAVSSVVSRDAVRDPEPKLDVPDRKPWRTRDEYNAYMRQYMKAYRKRKAK